MKITLEEYMKNPLGKANPMFTASVRESLRADYSARFDTLLVRENGKINYTWYFNKSRNEYYCHIKIPSERLKKLYYDVVIKFFADASVKELGQNLEQYYVQFFANDPAFMYTYANAYITNDLFIRDLQSKMGKKAIKKPAGIKNPQAFTGYAKSIYFAYLFLRMKGFLSTTIIQPYVQPYAKSTLLRNVLTTDQIAEIEQDEGSKQKKVKENRSNNKNVTSDQTIGRVQSIGKVKNVGKVGSVKSVKKR